MKKVKWLNILTLHWVILLFLFWRSFWILFKNMIGHIGRSNHPIWLTLLANHESAGLKTFKITAMTSLILKKKLDFADICQIICTKFHWNWCIRLGCAFPHTYRQTDAHTHTHLGPPLPRAVWGHVPMQLQTHVVGRVEEWGDVWPGGSKLK